MVDFVAGFLSAWILRSLLERRLRQPLRPGSNPPPPGRKPTPPAGPPEQPLAAQLIRYWAWEEDQVRRALGLDDPIRFDEGQTQRGNDNGGPTAPKLPIKPQPTGGHLVREGQMWGGYQPRPQGGTPNPPPAEP
jgi:hypothetical protein